MSIIVIETSRHSLVIYTAGLFFKKPRSRLFVSVYSDFLVNSSHRNNETNIYSFSRQLREQRDLFEIIYYKKICILSLPRTTECCKRLTSNDLGSNVKHPISPYICQEIMKHALNIFMIYKYSLKFNISI